MANSSIVSTLKDKIIAEIINDETIFQAINSPTVKCFDDSAELINKHIFRYNQNPNTLDSTITFLTLQVHIPESYGARSSELTWVKPRLEIWVYSHESCMTIKNIPKITANRNDYISQILDEKFNGRNQFGLPGDKNPLQLFGELELVSNVEGVLKTNYLFRQLIFSTKDLNDSLCKGYS